MPLADADDNVVTNGDRNKQQQSQHGSLQPVCAALAARINAFLDVDPKLLTPLQKAMQEQTEAALGVISTVLERYRCVHSHLLLSIWKTSKLTARGMS